MQPDFMRGARRSPLDFVTPLLWILGVVSCVISFLVIYNHVQSWGQ